MFTAAKIETQFQPPPICAFGANGFVFSLAAKPHQGHRLPTAVLYQGFAPVISSTTTGIAASLYDFRVRPRCTGQERDADTAADLTGFDNFQARMLAGSQGRFLSPDPDNAGAAPEYPQTWNAYGYVANNPLANTDPDGLFCPATGCNPDDYWNYLNGLQTIWDLTQLMYSATLQGSQQIGQQLVQHIGSYVSAPRNQNCVNALAARAGQFGTGLGMVGGGILGIEGGPPGVALTASGGAALMGGAGVATGAGIGWLMCSSNNGQTEGGGKRGDYRPKTRGANSRDAKNIRDVARQKGIDAKNFGDYVEDVKPDLGHGPSDNFTYKKLLELADEYKSAGGK